MNFLAPGFYPPHNPTHKKKDRISVGFFMSGCYRNFLNGHVDGLQSGIPNIESSVDSLKKEYQLK